MPGIERGEIIPALKGNMGLFYLRHSVPLIPPDPKIFTGASDPGWNGYSSAAGV